tara:strand:+ start:56 stop:490 length:435 start_codon:yes stop_codon:yes gene_type:complete
MECGICYETFDHNEFKLLDCKHYICIICFPKLKVYTCPFCREPISNYYTNNEVYIYEENNDIDEDMFLTNSFDIVETYYNNSRINRRRRRATIIPVRNQTNIRIHTNVEPITNESSVEPISNEIYIHFSDNNRQIYRNNIRFSR